MLDQGAVVLVEVETPRRVVVFKGTFVPLGPMADNPRLVGRESGEVHLAQRQDLRPVGTVEHRQVEFAAVDELLGKMGPARPGGEFPQELADQLGVALAESRCRRPARGSHAPRPT